MAGQIIDSLVVTLGLDPAKFGSGAQAAQRKLAEFNRAIKDLGVNEDKLSDKQKKALVKLREHEVQAARTGKELKATQSAGVSLFSALEKGALGFGAALGLYSLEQFARSSITSGAALSRLSHTLGISAQAAETWGIAIKESVGGSADDVLGTLQSFGDALQGFQFNPAGLEPLRRLAAILSRANGGKTIPLFDKSGAPLPADEVLKSMADPVQAMGAQKAHALLAGMLPDDVINMLLLGRKGIDAALTKAHPDARTNRQLEDDRKLEQQMNELDAAFTKLKNTILALSVPSVTAVLKDMLIVGSALHGEISWSEAWKRIKTNADMAHDSPDDPGGHKWRARIDAEDALGRLPFDGNPENSPNTRSRAPRPGTSFYKSAGSWTDEQKVTRLQQLFLAGKSADEAISIVTKEMAGGAAPPSAAEVQSSPNSGSVGGSGGNPSHLNLRPLDPENPTLNPIDPVHRILLGDPRAATEAEASSGLPAGLLTNIENIEDPQRDPNAVSPKGARGYFQIMPGTQAHLSQEYGDFDTGDEWLSAHRAGQYIEELRKHYSGDMFKAIAAYNWGSGNVDDDEAKHGENWRKFLPPSVNDYVNRAVKGVNGISPDGLEVATINQYGQVTIVTKATDAHGIAKDFKKAIVNQANQGPA